MLESRCDEELLKAEVVVAGTTNGMGPSGYTPAVRETLHRRSVTLICLGCTEYER
jgi:hypothetical protein